MLSTDTCHIYRSGPVLMSIYIIIIVVVTFISRKSAHSSFKELFMFNGINTCNVILTDIHLKLPLAMNIKILTNRFKQIIFRCIESAFSHLNCVKFYSHSLIFLWFCTKADEDVVCVSRALPKTSADCLLPKIFIWQSWFWLDYNNSRNKQTMS